jgi:Methyltransferase domain
MLLSEGTSVLPLIPLLVAVCVGLTPPGAVAQPAEYAPRLGQPGKDEVWEPTPDATVERMLRMARTTVEDYVVDLGAGDGRIVIAAARNFGARATGIEYDARLAALAQSRILQAGLGDRAQIVQGDLFDYDFSRATVVTLYVGTSVNLRLRDRLLAMQPGTRVVSHEYDMGDWNPDERARVAGVDLFLWTVPARVAGEWEFRFFDGMPEETRHVRLAQRYQYAQGDLGEVRLEGSAISFVLHRAEGAPLLCKGWVRSAGMQGRCRAGGAGTRPGRWTAVRQP